MMMYESSEFSQVVLGKVKKAISEYFWKIYPASRDLSREARGTRNLCLQPQNLLKSPPSKNNRRTSLIWNWSDGFVATQIN